MQKVHFVIDEAATVLRGSMPVIEEGFVIGRSYGLRFHFFFQSLGQLKETFRDKESVLLDNCDKIFFGFNSYENADYVSKMLGTRTIITEDASQSTSWSSNNSQQPSSSVNRSTGRSWREQGRELAKPAELLQFHPDLILAFIRGVRPILCWRVKWFEDPRFGGTRPGRLRSALWWVLMAGAVSAIAWSVWR